MFRHRNASVTREDWQPDLHASLASIHCNASTDRIIPVCWHRVGGCDVCLSLQQIRQDDRLHKVCFLNSTRVAAGESFRGRNVTTILSLQCTIKTTKLESPHYRSHRPL